MERAKGCEKGCQQAVEYGVWPEHECKPRCVFLDRPKDEQIEKWEALNPAEPLAIPSADVDAPF